MTARVVVTGMGCVSGLGLGLEETWRRVAGGESAIHLADRELETGGQSFRFSGPAGWLDQEACEAKLAGLDLRRLGHLDPISIYALVAALEAADMADLRGHDVLERKTAVLIGCGSGGNSTIDLSYAKLYAQGRSRVHPQTISSSMTSVPASHVAMALGIHGPAFVLASACASSAHAIGEAMHMVRSGRAEVAIAGGSEACLTHGSWVAWNSLGVLAPDTCRPFSAERKGMVLGEGAAIVVLESEAHARRRGAQILGELAGYGASSDAADITSPDQAGIEIAIRAAHEDAGASTNRGALISTHGTGTRINDAVEAAALRSVYGEALADATVIATKSAHGHLIGATAAIEFVIGMKALAEGTAPPVLNHLAPDPECDLPLALEPTPIEHDVLVSNSFAFGGLNAVLIGRKAA